MASTATLLSWRCRRPVVRYGHLIDLHVGSMGGTDVSAFVTSFFLSFLIMKNHVFAKHRLQIERDVLVSVTTVLPHKKNFDRLSSVCFAKPLGCIWWWWSHYALRFWLFENIFGFEKCGSLDFHRPCNKSAFKLYRSIFPDELSLPLLTKMQ